MDKLGENSHKVETKYLRWGNLDARLSFFLPKYYGLNCDHLKICMMPLQPPTSDVTVSTHMAAKEWPS